MTVLKYRKIPIEIVEKQNPVLANTIDENFIGVSKEVKESIAGLVIEAVLSSGGTITIFDEYVEDYEDDF